MNKQELTAEELRQYLKGLQIRETGIEAILETFPLGVQRLKVKQMIEYHLGLGESPREAVKKVWLRQHWVQIVRALPAGEKPTEKDFLKL